MPVLCLILFIVIKKEKLKKVFGWLTIILALVCCIIPYYNTIEFYCKSLAYKWVDNYDYQEEQNRLGHITEKGAIKIAKDYTNVEKISEVQVVNYYDSYYTVSMRTSINGKIFYCNIDYNSGEIISTRESFGDVSPIANSLIFDE